MKAITYELDNRAVDFLVRELAAGKSLSQHLLLRIRNERASALTYLPEGISDDDLYDFRDGVLPVDKRGIEHPQVALRDGSSWTMTLKRTMDDIFARTIESYLQVSRSRFCVFEDNGATVESAVKHKGETHIAIFNDEVYRVVMGHEADLKARVSVTLQAATSWLTVCVLADCDPDESSWSSGKIEKSDVDKLARDSDRVIVGAYDGEGFIIWQPVD